MLYEWGELQEKAEFLLKKLDRHPLQMKLRRNLTVAQAIMAIKNGTNLGHELLKDPG